ncbi:hypothetical protein [Neptunomonas antarctica]|uniref:Uncharacterized protein n=1 Tax=Neptunomonas antarctica TaxID=619304 RepID=A0A1N7M9E6_9GAMM|nr:hypothetical protein [Neptunomonas antarctica]SIS82714.1 hypothetical protein SAMN05421760_105288 [Neptunomonas antarctica]
MEERHKNLKSEKQKTMINKIIAKISDAHPSFYYLSTSEVAFEIKTYIDTTGNLSKEEQDLLENLDHRDIQMLLSLHN